jgi:L-malate glycosyltransferase
MKDNILLLTDSLNVGGKEILLINIMEYLEYANFNIHLLILQNTGESLNRVHGNKRCVFLNRRKKLDILTLFQLRDYIKTEQVNILHTNGWIDTLYASIATHGLRIKKIVTIHGFHEGWRNWVFRQLTNRYDCIINVSKEAEKISIDKGYKTKVMRIIQNGYTSQLFKPKPLFFSKVKPLNLIMVSRFDKKKDHLTLVRAVNYLNQTGFKINLYLVGGGSEKIVEEIKIYVDKLNLTDKVYILGPRNDVNELLQHMDIFVLSSFSETFGISVVEAMASGIPVIVSDHPALLEVIEYGKYGLQFKTADYLDLANKISVLIQNKKIYLDFCNKSILRARDYTIESCVNKLLHLYDEFLL